MYPDISHEKLGLFLAEADIDVTRLQVIKSSLCGINGFSVEYGILGTSHYFKIRKADRVFCEIFSCSPIEEKGLFYPISYLKKGKAVGANSLGRAYNFTTDVDTLTEGSQKYYSFLANTTREEVISLTHEFPGQANQKYKPYTSVKIMSEGDGLCLQSMHVYPEENIVVFTQSKI